MTGYRRYVALGDSQTEGLGDLRADGSPRGWADRLAERLAATTSPGLGYANLAVRGCRARHVAGDQLPAALALAPDFATVVVGANDLLRHDYDADETFGHIEATVVALLGAGCAVATMTIPDVGAMIPALRWLRPREAALNGRIRDLGRRYDVPVLDVFPLLMCADPAMWNPDRIHGSALGHTRIAAGMAHLLGLPDATPDWQGPPPDALGRGTVLRRDAWWIASFAVPFLLRQLRGTGPMSVGQAKRPALEPVRPYSPSAVSSASSSSPA